MDRYASMSIGELEAESNAWDQIILTPKGPGWPSNTAREVARRHCDEIDGWLARRVFEADNPQGDQ